MILAPRRSSPPTLAGRRPIDKTLASFESRLVLTALNHTSRFRASQLSARYMYDKDLVPRPRGTGTVELSKQRSDDRKNVNFFISSASLKNLHIAAIVPCN